MILGGGILGGGRGNLLAAANEVVERSHGLFRAGGGVEAMNLEKVDVVRFETLQRCIHSREDGAPRET